MKTKFIIGGVASAAASLFLLMVLFGSFYTVDEGERTVLLRNGAVVGTSAPGWHLKTPIIESTVDMSVRTERRRYEMSAYSKDVQSANIVVTVNYHLDPSMVGEVYANFGETYVTRLLDPAVYAQAKVAFGNYTATRSIAERGSLNKDMYEIIADAISHPSIVVEGIQIEDITFSDQFNRAVEERMQAEIEVQKLKQNKEREVVQADIVRTQAQGRADAKKAEADAEAYSITVKAKAEAESINLKGMALRENPNLVSLITAEAWDGKLPMSMIPEAAVPFVNVNK